MIRPCPPGHQIAVDDIGCVDERPARRLYIYRKRRIRRAATALEHPVGREMSGP